MNHDTKSAIIFILIFLFAFIVLHSNYVKKSDIRELMEDKLVDEFHTVSLYLEGEEYSRDEALDAFNTIEEELNTLY